jgi:HYDIN/CFA65/VesB family protein
VKIKNHGKGMLNGTVSGPAGAPFSATGTGPFALAPGNSRQVKVTFSPTSMGTFSAQLTITSDDPNRPSINVPITGIAK